MGPGRNRTPSGKYFFDFVARMVHTPGIDFFQFVVPIVVFFPELINKRDDSAAVQGKALLVDSHVFLGEVLPTSCRLRP